MNAFWNKGSRYLKNLCTCLYKNTLRVDFIVDCKLKPRSLILEQEYYAFIDNAMLKNDELKAYQLIHKLNQAYPELLLSLSTVCRARRDLVWVSSTPRYYQLIREINKVKRMKWCQDVSPDDEFEVVI